MSHFTANQSQPWGAKPCPGTGLTDRTTWAVHHGYFIILHTQLLINTMRDTRAECWNVPPHTSLMRNHALVNALSCTRVCASVKVMETILPWHIWCKNIRAFWVFKWNKWSAQRRSYKWGEKQYMDHYQSTNHDKLLIDISDWIIIIAICFTWCR